MSRVVVCLLGAMTIASLMGCGDESGPRPAAVPSNRWVVDAPWIRDPEGRVKLLRASNYSGLEWGYFSDQPHGPEEADFAQIASWGITTIRLPIAWTYLEPQPNQIDVGYLTREVDRVIDFAARHGMSVIIDMHQFNWSSCFPGGLGIPPWTCEGKYPPNLLGQFRAQSEFWRGGLAPDGRPLLDHFVEAWRAVATYYRDSPTVVAFDLFNEPLDAGDLRTKPLEQVAMEFEHNTLFPFYRRLAAELRAVGAEQTLMVEPASPRNLGNRAHPEPVGDDNVIYSPHIYLGADIGGYTGTQEELSAQYEQGMVEAAEMNAPLWVGEWGGGDPTFYAYSLRAEDQFLIGGGVWGYFPSGNELVNAEGRENEALVDVLVHPYPIQTAGLPVSLSWDRSTKTFDYVWREDPTAKIPDPTILFVPLARHYEGRFKITTSPGESVTVEGDRVIIHANHKNTTHELHVTAE